MLGVTAAGQKTIMGVRIGSTENSQVCRDLLTDLVDRGLVYEKGLLAIIDGSKAGPYAPCPGVSESGSVRY